MKQTAVVTGASGCLGRILVPLLEAHQYKVVIWDRSLISPKDPDSMKLWLQRVHPAVIFHLAYAGLECSEHDAMILNVRWPEYLASLARKLGCRLVFISSVEVFDESVRGPLTLESEPNATEHYGGYKRLAEERVRHTDPEAVIIRLGWQLGRGMGQRNLINWCEDQMAEHGVIRAHPNAYPACSFLEDTAHALTEVAWLQGGTYMLDSNDRWTHYQIIAALNHCLGNPWKVVACRLKPYDRRMLDDRLRVPLLYSHLPELDHVLEQVS